jgi:D-serine deaminase-like pyridoxal phosphate-dependent protein
MTFMALPAHYAVAGAEDLLTPALIVDADAVDHNIAVTLAALGSASRWRPHLKTAKLRWTMERLVSHGVHAAKCATSLELRTACEAGFRDLVLAYPVTGPNARRVHQIAAGYPHVAVSVLVEVAAQAEVWRGSNVGVFLDVNSGMNRTGLDGTHFAAVVALARAVPNFRGLHFYDGHMHIADLAERRRAAFAGYDRLLQLVETLRNAGLEVQEIITSGTPAMPCAAEYPGFQGQSFVHRISPGTVVYNDTTSMPELPMYAYRPAVFVLSTVVSHPLPQRFTCDAGHKSVSADAGVPTCAVVGHPDWVPQKPSEEHLPVDVAGLLPAIGERLYLVPRHVCPTVNNFAHAVLVRGGAIASVENVEARGREMPQLLLAEVN